MSTPNPHYGQNAAVLLSRTYVFAAFGGRWPGVAFFIWRYINCDVGIPSLGPSVPFTISPIIYQN